MPDQEMIERVAEAIFTNYDWPWSHTKNYNKLMGHQKAIFYKFVIAAIKAMREPTEKMVDHARLSRPFIELDKNSRATWIDMIDSILND